LEAIRWIAYDNPAAAKGLRDAVSKAATNVGVYPQIGISRPDLADPPYRFVKMTGYPYVVVYHPDRQPPLIVRILHGARDLPEMLREL
jgi:toxin ParE1/3/4